MNTILVPTDFSTESFAAIASASTLARKTDAKLVIFHVNDEEASKTEEWRELMSHPWLSGVLYEMKAGAGDPVQEIVEQQADLIVMGSKGAEGLKGFFVGSNSEKVAKAANCPVIVLKDFTDLSAIRSIVHPTNMREDQHDVVEEVKKLQQFYGAHLHLFKVYEGGLVQEHDVIERLTAYAEKNGLTDYSVTACDGSDQAEEILEFANGLDADMIAMATHDRRGLEKLLGGYISGEVINTSKIPIWTMVAR